MHPAIAEIASTVFYKGKLKNGVTKEERKQINTFEWANKDIPMMFYHVEGEEQTLEDGKSYLNVSEAY